MSLVNRPQMTIEQTGHMDKDNQCMSVRVDIIPPPFFNSNMYFIVYFTYARVDEPTDHRQHPRQPTRIQEEHDEQGRLIKVSYFYDYLPLPYSRVEDEIVTPWSTTSLIRHVEYRAKFRIGSRREGITYPYPQSDDTALLEQYQRENVEVEDADKDPTWYYARPWKM